MPKFSKTTRKSSKFYKKKSYLLIVNKHKCEGAWNKNWGATFYKNKIGLKIYFFFINI